MTSPATGTASQASRERREAARALLIHPLLTLDHAGLAVHEEFVLSDLLSDLESR